MAAMARAVVAKRAGVEELVPEAKLVPQVAAKDATQSVTDLATHHQRGDPAPCATLQAAHLVQSCSSVAQLWWQRRQDQMHRATYHSSGGVNAAVTRLH